MWLKLHAQLKFVLQDLDAPFSDLEAAIRDR